MSIKPASYNLKITTCNLFNYVQPPFSAYESENIYTNDEWRKKQSWLSDTLTQLNSDIIAFQEVFSFHALEQQMQTLGYNEFRCLDLPHTEHEYICSRPPVAIASRYPIEQAELLSVPEELIKNGLVTAEFEFSRRPLHVTVRVPQLGLVDFYVVHFKSQRPDDNAVAAGEEYRQIGSWLSAMQRGLEANVLLLEMKKIKALHQRPCILLGDFNQVIPCSEFANLISAVEQADFQDLATLHLFDSWELYCRQLDMSNLAWSRQATHYYGSLGNVLDYILLSQEFYNDNDKDNGGLLSVIDIEVTDKHLINPSFEAGDHIASDHALVSAVVQIK
ncbi:endonuclease/exonuclease/phosphatase family protein [Vibrio sp. SCSIO 43137]|uniref:endonuclease/exonuclease/phosphatase family protein n=1 Tax=Vibrio sp. SCSIO 43137 TaxID=3021011 RepID=UPI0023082B2A|nr:endonuclease/exonuclease/phosphatase family protein [Vibrio sp. SCSIO 43137]WCE32363.1 endonuclease/exonuclease/phosphatase family protein [Vibrio sp. SCSIO 43137]